MQGDGAEGVRYNSKAWNDNSTDWYESPYSKLNHKIQMSASKFFKTIEDKDAALLDLGCGTGEFLKLFHARGYGNLYGVEPDKELVRRIPPNTASVTVGFAENLPFKDESLDVVFIYCVLHHLKGFPNYEQCMSELDRVLKKGGHVFIMEPASWHLFRAMEMIVHILGGFSRRFKNFSEVLQEEQVEQHLFIKNHRIFRDFFKSKDYGIVVDRYVFYWVFTARKRI